MLFHSKTPIVISKQFRCWTLYSSSEFCTNFWRIPLESSKNSYCKKAYSIGILQYLEKSKSQNWIRKSRWFFYRWVNFKMSFWCLQFPPKNEQKQVDLSFHNCKVYIICLFSLWDNIGLKKYHFYFVWPLIILGRSLRYFVTTK